ncbi:MAG: exodeoxyribonuclease VII small subunit [Chlamydia sp.]
MEQHSYENFSYEEVFKRLETILEEMNSHNIQLEKSLDLFEEADTLMKICQTKLSNAEKRIEIVLKGKNGALITDKNGLVETKSFYPEKNSS